MASPHQVVENKLSYFLRGYAKERTAGIITTNEGAVKLIRHIFPFNTNWKVFFGNKNGIYKEGWKFI
jgi:hypothetical protein